MSEIVHEGPFVPRDAMITWEPTSLNPALPFRHFDLDNSGVPSNFPDEIENVYQILSSFLPAIFKDYKNFHPRFEFFRGSGTKFEVLNQAEHPDVPWVIRTDMVYLERTPLYKVMMSLLNAQIELESFVVTPPFDGKPSVATKSRWADAWLVWGFEHHQHDFASPEKSLRGDPVICDRIIEDIFAPEPWSSRSTTMCGLNVFMLLATGGQSGLRLTQEMKSGNLDDAKQILVEAAPRSDLAASFLTFWNRLVDG